MSKGSRSVKCHRWQPHDVSVTYSRCKSTPWSRCYCWTVSPIVCGGCRLLWLAHPECSHSANFTRSRERTLRNRSSWCFYFEGEHPLFPVCVTLLKSRWQVVTCCLGNQWLPRSALTSNSQPELNQEVYEPVMLLQGEGPAQVDGLMVRSDFRWCSYRQTGKSQELVS